MFTLVSSDKGGGSYGKQDYSNQGGKSFYNRSGTDEGFTEYEEVE